MNKLDKAFCLLAVIASTIYFVVAVKIVEYPTKKPAPTYETDNTNFFNGEILLPDYVHIDTLIVKDAAFLNWAMENYDAGSDGDISDILSQSTVKY